MHTKLVPVSFLLLIFLGQIAGGIAADPAAPPKEDARRKPLPTHFGMLGVSDDQKEKLYALQDEYEVRMEKLREELRLLVRERDKKMEGLLTAGQKLRLKELRDQARQKAEEKAQEKAQEKPAPEAK